MSSLRWFVTHTLPQTYYAVRYKRERSAMHRRVLASFARDGYYPSEGLPLLRRLWIRWWHRA